MKQEEIKNRIKQLIGETLLPWEEDYLNFHTRRYQESLELLGSGAGKSLLDLGAFPGHLSVAARDRGYQVNALTGTNESTTFLDNFIQRLARHDIPVDLADVESGHLPYPDKCFDVVLATEIIEHLPFNPYHMLREAFRVLRPQGRLILSTPNLAKLDNLLHFALGRTIHPHVRLPFFKTFKSILIGRHIREYTADELGYMLEKQNKEMYRFDNTRISYSMCLDPAFSWPGAAAWLVKCLWPRFRATLCIEAFRPAEMELIDPAEITARGFYDTEEHPVDLGSTGRVLATPFRWSERRAELHLPAGTGAYQIFYLHLVFLAPKSLPPSILNLTMPGCNLGRIAFPPDLEYALVRITLPGHLAREGRFILFLENTTWCPAENPGRMDYYEYSISDNRNLGLALGWDGFLREDVPDWETLQKIARREWERQPVHQESQPSWGTLLGLYFIRAFLKPDLTMGSEDWSQLGPGWHYLERWPQGWIRWTSRLAEAYLAPGPKGKKLVARVYSGDPALGREVTGSLELEWSEDRLVFRTLISRIFQLPGDVWQDLEVDLPGPLSPKGLLRVLLKVDAPRVPAFLIKGSRDERELGLAVSALRLV
jgi:2-polyprenyl-3-methyl-5-hydroxy-6-metoxy-1,4-benzoquinol methylase